MVGVGAAAGEEEAAPFWPPPALPAASDALKVEVPISPELDHWTSPDLAVTAVKDVVCCRDRVVLLLAGCAGPLRHSNLALWQPPPGPPPDDGSQDAAALQALVLQGFPAAPEPCSRLWPGDATSFYATCGGGVWRVDLDSLSAPPASGDEPLTATAAQVFTLPPRLGGFACCVRQPRDDAGGAAAAGLLCAMLVRPEQLAESASPWIASPGQSLQQLPASQLCLFDPGAGLRAAAAAPRLSEELVLSGGSRQVCVWRAMLNEVPEEAERGEFLAFDCSQAAAGAGSRGEPAAALCLTRGAGRVGAAAVADGGELILLQANFSEERPITTHMALLLLHWPRGEPRPRPERRFLIEGQHLLSFGFLPSSQFYVTRLVGADPETALWRHGGGGGDGAEVTASPGPRLRAAALSRSVGVLGGHGSGAPGRFVFGSERADALPEAAVAGLPAGAAEEEEGAAEGQQPVRLFALPQPRGASALSVEKITYTHRGEQVTALLCERKEPPCPLEAPLLVHAHGGPAVGVICSQRLAADALRYPYRHFLMAGYRVLQPLFRGTLGFGDKWAQGNIGSQGSVEGDLGDILAGLDWLQSSHPRLRGSLAPERTGIFGGSYGGYMTLRAMSSLPSRFAAGVALYGFVHNRWMTYEGGDFTWEDEYIVPPPLEASGVDFELVEQEDDDVQAQPLQGGNSSAHASSINAASLSAVSGGESPGRSPTRSRLGSRHRAGSDTSLAPSQCASDVWPLPKEMEASDSFQGLHRIVKPVLLMHGEKDDICPLSQSQVAFHMLEKKGVPTGLVVYPGEGHGFDRPEHQRDRDRRMLAWFLEHLPGDRGLVPDLREK